VFLFFLFYVKQQAFRDLYYMIKFCVLCYMICCGEVKLSRCSLLHHAMEDLWRSAGNYHVFSVWSIFDHTVSNLAYGTEYEGW